MPIPKVTRDNFDIAMKILLDELQEDSNPSLKIVFRKVKLRVHPDKGGHSEQFQVINSINEDIKEYLEDTKPSQKKTDGMIETLSRLRLPRDVLYKFIAKFNSENPKFQIKLQNVKAPVTTAPTYDSQTSSRQEKTSKQPNDSQTSSGQKKTSKQPNKEFKVGNIYKEPINFKKYILPLDARKFKDLKEQFQAFKGDQLKYYILKHFEDSINKASSLEELNAIKEGILNSAEYKVLATPQGLLAKTGLTKYIGISDKTSSIVALESMFTQKNNYFERNKFRP